MIVLYPLSVVIEKHHDVFPLTRVGDLFEVSVGRAIMDERYHCLILSLYALY